MKIILDLTMNTWNCHVKHDARAQHVENWNVTIKNRDALASKIGIYDLPSGEQPHSNGKIHHVSWENPLFLCPFSIANC